MPHAHCNSAPCWTWAGSVIGYSLPMTLPRIFDLPDEVSEWDDKNYFTFLQDHQFGYQALLDELKASGQEQSAEYQH